MSDPLSKWLRSLPQVSYVLALLMASYAIVVPFAMLEQAVPYFETGFGPFQSFGPVERLLAGCIIAPLIETALFQWGPIWLLRGTLHLSWPFVLPASAALFAISHPYSVGYLIFAFLVGLVLAYCFAVANESSRRPFVVTSIVHGLRNGIAIALM